MRGIRWIAPSVRHSGHARCGGGHLILGTETRGRYVSIPDTFLRLPFTRVRQSSSHLPTQFRGAYSSPDRNAALKALELLYPSLTQDSKYQRRNQQPPQNAYSPELYPDSEDTLSLTDDEDFFLTEEASESPPDFLPQSTLPVQPSGSHSQTEYSSNSVTGDSLPGILIRTIPHRRRKPGIYADFWRSVPLPNPFDQSSSYNYDIYMQSLMKYRHVTGFTSDSVIPHLMTALQIGHKCLSPCQLSRLAACAIRMAVRHGQYKDALDITDSLCGSRTAYTLRMLDTLYKNAESSTAKIPRSRSRGLLDFGQEVPLRLAYHSLLHAQLQRHYPIPATITAGIMFLRGISIRGPTLIALVRVLCKWRKLRSSEQNDAVVSGGVTSESSSGNLDIPEGFSVRKAAVGKSRFVGIPLAYAVLDKAYKHGSSVVGELYRIIIDTCISRGEVVIASLLYTAMLHHLDKHPEQDHLGEWRKIKGSDEAASVLLTSLVEQLRFLLTRKYNSTIYGEALQASTNLVSAFEEGAISTEKLGPLISVLALYRNTSHNVWVHHRFRLTRVNAYLYVRCFVLRLIYSQLELSPDDRPSLDRQTYNSLIAYAFDTFNCPLLAIGLVERMDWGPDEETLDILVRNAAHLRPGNFSPATWETLSWDMDRIHDGSIYASYPWDEGTPLDSEEEERYFREYQIKLQDPHLTAALEENSCTKAEIDPVHVQATQPDPEAKIATETKKDGFRNFVRYTRDLAMNEAVSRLRGSALRVKLPT